MIDQNINLYCKIYELKGLISSLSCLASIDDSYDNPLIEQLDSTINEVLKEIGEVKHG